MTETIINAEAGIVRCEHKKAAIIGTGYGRDAAPWGDPTWCKWALNEIFPQGFDRHFELHPMVVQSVQDLAWLARCPTPCYVLNLTDATTPGIIIGGGLPREQLRVANAVQYPLDRVVAVTTGRRYFTCTFSYQIALALADGFEAIGLWGVGLYGGTARERTAERTCTEYWLGVAEGRGVTVVADSGLARQPYLYGYDYDQEVKYVNAEVAKLRTVIEHEATRRARAEEARGG